MAEDENEYESYSLASHVSYGSHELIWLLSEGQCVCIQHEEKARTRLKPSAGNPNAPSSHKSAHPLTA